MAFVSPSTWRKWRELCSVGACASAERHELHSLFAVNLRAALKQLRGTLPTDRSDADFAALADEYFKPGSEETGKRSKSAYFQRFRHIEHNEVEWAKVATVYFGRVLANPKSAANYVARRYGRTGPIRPDLSAHDAAAAAQLDPEASPDALAALADLPEIAARLAAGFFLTLSVRQQAVLWAIAMNLQLDDDSVLAKAGCGKSTLFSVRNALGDELRRRLAHTFTSQEPEELDILALEIAKAMLPHAKKWGTTGIPLG